MIKVTYGTTVDRNEAVVSSSTTIKAFCQDHDIDYSVSVPYLDGRPVNDMNKTFAECGITEECRLISVVKATNS